MQILSRTAGWDDGRRPPDPLVAAPCIGEVVNKFTLPLLEVKALL